MALYLKLGCALAIALLLWAVFHSISEAAVANERARIAEARADSLYVIGVESQRALEEMQVQARAKIDSATVVKDSALAIARNATSRRTAVVERVIERNGSSEEVRAAVTAVVDSLVTQEIEPRDVVIKKDAQIRTTLEDELARANETIASLRTALEAARNDAEAQKAARPGWLSRNAPRATSALLGLFAGFLLAHR